MNANEIQCVNCHDSFVEELPSATVGPENPTEQIVIGNNPFDMFPGSPFSRLFSRIVTQPQRTGSPTNMPSVARTRSNPHLQSAGSSRQFPSQSEQSNQQQGSDEPDQMANFLQQILSNILSQSMGQQNTETDNDGRGHFSIRFIAGPSTGSGGQGIFSVHSNLNDYAWGPNGLDNILTALLNQFDEAQERSRALRPEDIKRIPMVKVTQKHVENGTQCTTCMETFNLGEDVAKLNCDHIFHRPCIEPWLQRNNTCPICRTQIDPNVWEPKIADVDELD